MGKKKRWCDFCGKADHEVDRLLPGPCYICNECVDMMYKMIHEPEPILPVKPVSKLRETNVITLPVIRV